MKNGTVCVSVMTIKSRRATSGAPTDGLTDCSLLVRSWQKSLAVNAFASRRASEPAIYASFSLASQPAAAVELYTSLLIVFRRPSEPRCRSKRAASMLFSAFLLWDERTEGRKRQERRRERRIIFETRSVIGLRASFSKRRSSKQSAGRPASRATSQPTVQASAQRTPDRSANFRLLHYVTPK